MMLTPKDESNKMMFATRDNGDDSQQAIRSSGSFPDNQWVHVAVTLKMGTEGILYIDGKEDKRGRITLTPADVIGENSWFGQKSISSPSNSSRSKIL